MMWSSTVKANAMKQHYPVIFVSHGAPDILLNPGPTLRLWAELGRQLPRPRAILAVSAHWESAVPKVSATLNPATIHDFGGFSPALYEMQYTAPGAVELAGRVGNLLRAAAIPVEPDMERGLDHGAWVPLKVIYPAADIPVIQLSIQPNAGPEWHLRLGEALRPLRDQGVLILASGSATHNFGWLSVPGSPPLPQAVEFAEWLGNTLEKREIAALLDYRRQAPYGAAAHPTEDHILPFFVALGAAWPDEQASRFMPEYTYGALAMDAYLWQSQEQAVFMQESQT